MCYIQKLHLLLSYLQSCYDLERTQWLGGQGELTARCREEDNQRCGGRRRTLLGSTLQRVDKDAANYARFDSHGSA